MELLRCKIHRIYSVRTDISPNGDMCALRGVLQTALISQAFAWKIRKLALAFKSVLHKKIL